MEGVGRSSSAIVCNVNRPIEVIVGGLSLPVAEHDPGCYDLTLIDKEGKKILREFKSIERGSISALLNKCSSYGAGVIVYGNRVGAGVKNQTNLYD